MFSFPYFYFCLFCSTFVGGQTYVLAYKTQIRQLSSTSANIRLFLVGVLCHNVYSKSRRVLVDGGCSFPRDQNMVHELIFFFSLDM